LKTKEVAKKRGQKESHGTSAVRNSSRKGNLENKLLLVMRAVVQGAKAYSEARLIRVQLENKTENNLHIKPRWFADFLGKSGKTPG